MKKINFNVTQCTGQAVSAVLIHREMSSGLIRLFAQFNEF